MTFNKSQLIKIIKGDKLLTLMLIVICLSCNDEFTNQLNSEYPDEKYYPTSSRVLHIVIDGVTGDNMRQLSPQNIMKLTQKSIYSFNGLADNSLDTLNEKTAWANLLTGVQKNKHGVRNSSNGNNIQQYPIYLKRIEDKQPDLNSRAFLSDEEFYGLVGNVADTTGIFSNENSLTQELINTIEFGNPDVILAEYSSPYKIGLQTGFDTENETYRNAVLRIDDFIGEIVNSLKNRQDYAKENWLVILSSSIGGNHELGEVEDPFDDRRKNIFTLIFNEKFETQLIQKPILSDVRYTGYGVNYTYNDEQVVQAQLKNELLYNIDENSKYTFQFLTKVKEGNYGYPSILSKRARDFGGPGWNLFLEGNYWVLNTSMSGQLYGATISDGQWHSITVVFDRIESVRSTIKIYTDGVLNAESTRNHTDNDVSNETPLLIGRNTNGDNRPELLLTHLQVYDTIIQDQEIMDLACRTEISNSHPYYDHLIGYWPGNEIGESVLKERTDTYGAQADFELQGPYNWIEFNDLSDNVCPPIPDSFFELVPNSVDIPYQIFQWLGVGVEKEWNLDGRGWIPNYNLQ